MTEETGELNSASKSLSRREASEVMEGLAFYASMSKFIILSAGKTLTGTEIRTGKDTQWENEESLSGCSCSLIRDII